MTISAQQKATYHNITAKEAYIILKNTPNTYIVDVRSANEFNDIHAENAVLITAFDMSDGTMKPINEFAKNISLKFDKSKDKLFLICKTSARSKAAAQILVDNGWSHENIYSINDGTLGKDGWKESNLPIITK